MAVGTGFYSRRNLISLFLYDILIMKGVKMEITPALLEKFKKKGLIWMFKWSPSKDTVRYHVKKGSKATNYRWRLTKSDLKFAGFIYMGAGCPWRCDFTNGKWKPVPKDASSI